MFLKSISLSALPLITDVDSIICMGPFSNGDTLTHSYTKTINLDFKIADSNDINYLDIQEGFIYYKYSNYTFSSYGLGLNIIHNDIWNKVYCINKDFDSLTALVPSQQDSVSYFNGVIGNGTYYALPFDTITIVFNCSGLRMFVKWDNSNNRSYVSITLNVNFYSQGDPVSYAR